MLTVYFNAKNRIFDFSGNLISYEKSLNKLILNKDNSKNPSFNLTERERNSKILINTRLNQDALYSNKPKIINQEYNSYKDTCYLTITNNAEDKSLSDNARSNRQVIRNYNHYNDKKHDDDNIYSRKSRSSNTRTEHYFNNNNILVSSSYNDNIMSKSLLEEFYSYDKSKQNNKLNSFIKNKQIVLTQQTKHTKIPNIKQHIVATTTNKGVK